MAPGSPGRIAVDAMGGDLGPSEVVAAVKLALAQSANLNPITLVGDEAVLRPIIAHYGLSPQRAPRDPARLGGRHDG